MTWAKGTDVIEALLAKGHLEQVPADPSEALYLLERARQHLMTAGVKPIRMPRSPTTRCMRPHEKH